MATRKNAPKVKATSKPTVKVASKPAANTVHSHSELETSIEELKRQCNDYHKEAIALKNSVKDLKNIIDLLLKQQNELSKDNNVKDSRLTEFLTRVGSSSTQPGAFCRNVKIVAKSLV